MQYVDAASSRISDYHVVYYRLGVARCHSPTLRTNGAAYTRTKILLRLSRPWVFLPRQSQQGLHSAMSEHPKAFPFPIAAVASPQSPAPPHATKPVYTLIMP